MPELPEVETIRIGLASVILHAELQQIHLRRTDIAMFVSDHLTLDSYVQKSLLSIHRHGKFLIFEFTSDLAIIIHLGMTGKLLFFPTNNADYNCNSESEKFLHDKHTHAFFHFSHGILVFNDIRRFGEIRFAKKSDLYTCKALLQHLGPDALDSEFQSETLLATCKHHKYKPIKALLLDQTCIAGIGNIYADEALFQAGIRPTRRAGNLTKKESLQLYEAIVQILQAAISAGGSTLRDYRTMDNHTGSFQNFHQVYGRSGSPCLKCHNTLKNKTVAGRTSVYCPHCQR